jgi:hypothetical protein
MTANATQHVHLDRSLLVSFCQSNHMRRLALFGSHLKGTEGPPGENSVALDSIYVNTQLGAITAA